MNVSNLPGRLIPNQLSGYLGVHNQMIVAATICGALAIAFTWMRNAAALVVEAIIYGFASGACVFIPYSFIVILFTVRQMFLFWHQCLQDGQIMSAKLGMLNPISSHESG